MNKLKSAGIILGTLATLVSFGRKVNAQFIDPTPINLYAIEREVCLKNNLRDEPRCKRFFPDSNDSNSSSNSRPITNSTDIKQLMQQGIEAYQKENYFVADTAFSEVIKLQPNFALAYAFRGLIQIKQGHKQDALLNLQKAENLLQEQGETNSDAYKRIQRLIEMLQR
ncbi:hypothetical protein H6G04_18695 [Calothrix membranacea FACHB-236]|nr:hypothetical protein [Calothrix membranacea FACHB-236]